MNHSMDLDDAPFEATRLGKKQIEIRVNNEERESIKSGDTITFENKGVTLVTVVIDKRIYKSILELAKSEDFSKTGGIYQNTKEWIKHIDSYYPREVQAKKGLLAIEIHLQ